MGKDLLRYRSTGSNPMLPLPTPSTRTIVVGAVPPRPAQGIGGRVTPMVYWDCLDGRFFLFFSRGVQNMIFVTNWVADGVPDAKLPRLCTEFRPESNGTSSGHQNLKQNFELLYYCLNFAR